MPSTPTGEPTPTSQPKPDHLLGTPSTPIDRTFGQPIQTPSSTPHPPAPGGLASGELTSGHLISGLPIQTPPVSGPLGPDSLFQLIKQFEAQVPIPAPYVTLNVGTLNAGTGAWSGLTTRVITDPEPVPHEPGQHPGGGPPRYVGAELIETSINAQWRRTTTVIPAPLVAVAPVLLQFSVANTSGPWSVTVNGYTQSAGAGQTSLSVNVWDKTVFEWSIRAGGASHSDQFRIQRQAGIPAFGAFTIPVIPVSIVYAPPADSQGKSTASYGETDTVGTTISWDLSTDSSQTTEPAFSDGAAFRAMLSVVSTALGIAGGAATDAALSASGAAATADKAEGAADSTAGKDLSSIASLFPSDTETQQAGSVEDNGGSMTVTYSQSSTLATTAKGGGPGAGDNIIFYKDVQVAWAYNDGQWLLCPFNWTFVTATAESLLNNPAAYGLASADQQTLLSLDPFVAGGAFATDLPGDRFTVPPTFQNSIEYGGGGSFIQSYTVGRDTKNTTTIKTYTTDTSTWQPGAILQMFGVGSTKTQTTTTLTNAQGTDVSSSVTLSVNLTSGPDDVFTIAIWYDDLFGTLAFQQLAASASPAFAGQGAEPGEVVTLELAGKVHATVADDKGNFAFRAPNIGNGSAQLSMAGKPPTPVEVGSGHSGIGIVGVLDHAGELGVTAKD